MRRLVLLLCCCLPAVAQVEIGGRNLQVTVAPDGGLTVAHRLTGRVYRSIVPPAPPGLVVTQASSAPRIDGQLDEWRAVPAVPVTVAMTGEVAAVDGLADCSAQARWLWDAQHLYLALEVTDDQITFAPQPALQWWTKDSVEVWLGATQVGFSLSPRGTLASLVSKPAEGVRIALGGGEPVGSQSGALRLVALTTKPGGYRVEVALPWAQQTFLKSPTVGATVPLALGINDADATGLREGQIYFPATWRHSQPDTFALATLGDRSGQAPARSGQPLTTIQALRRLPNGCAFRKTLFAGSSPVQADLTVTTAKDADAVEITLDLPDRTVDFRSTAYPAPLSAELPAGRLCYAPYMDGLEIPQNSPRFVNSSVGPAMDLPFVGLYDATKGDGYLLLLRTPHDGQIRLTNIAAAGEPKLVPQAIWLPAMGKFGAARRVRYEFVASGGWQALAQRYRQHALRDGHLKTLREKSKARPNIARLGGAPDVWGGDLAWALEASARGVERCLLNYTADQAKMRRANELGYLTSRYDNYADLLVEDDPTKWTNTKGTLDMCYHDPAGKQMLGWLTWDKKQQYYERSSATATAAARLYIPKDLQEHPYLGRFLDVTTASGLYEDYHPQRRQDRSGDVAARNKLFAYVNSLGLVTGGEHGRFWAVPYMDYFEGMMSGNSFFSWPAGHLLKSKRDDGKATPGSEDVSEEYRTYGLGPQYRIPLWSTIFHDCVVSYWYWGDTNDYHQVFEPTLTDRKDAFNVLYGTPPMYWANSAGFGRSEAGWQRLLDSYRRTCRWHEAVLYEPLTKFEYLTPDRQVQRSTFGRDYQAVVNFAAEPREVSVDGQTLRLPPDGFVARGPQIRVERVLQGDRVVQRIRSPRYAYLDGAGAEVTVAGLRGTGSTTVQIAAPDRLLIAAHSDAATLLLNDLVPGWDSPGTRAFRLDLDGQREAPLDLRPVQGKLVVPATKQVIELITGRRTALPDLRLGDVTTSQRAGLLRVSVPVHNAGLAAVSAGRLQVQPEGLPAQEKPLKIAAGQSATVMIELPTARLDGPRRLDLAVLAGPGQSDLIPGNNRGWRVVQFPFDRQRWPAAPLLRATVPATTVERPVALPLQLPPGVAPGSVRVVDAAEPTRPLLAQMESAAVVVLLPAGPERRLEVLGQTGATAALAPGGGFWSAAAQRLDTGVYRFALLAGVPSDIGIGAGPTAAIAMLTYSSADTGWVAEDGRLDKLEVVASGPVRTVLQVRRTLAGGKAVYTKTWTCYRDWLECLTEAQPSVTGLHNRAYYLQPGDYRDSLGKTTRIDGKGDDEARISGPPAAWIGVAGDGWAHSIVPLEPVGGQAYWDAGNMGGLGYQGTPARSRMAWVFHAGAVPANFAAQDAARLATISAAR
ncbi:MAG: hypothetical protein IT204_05380 [Fimbriimonadaceae bacterium]|nr:hypothetical protein [Fimbriimonadaceae bacterium]